MKQKSFLNSVKSCFAAKDESPCARAEELVSIGEYKLLQGYLSEALEAFAKAERLLGSTEPLLYFRQGLSLFEYGSEEGHEKLLILASKKFKTAHLLEPHNSEILQAWGNTLTHLGEQKEEHHFFLQAKEKYEKALKISPHSAELLWDYGAIWYHIGAHSEEAVDLQMSIQAFESAIENSHCLPTDFWVDFGATLLLLSTKVEDIRLIVRAIEAMKRAIALDKSSFNAWSGCAEALQMLYEKTHDEDHFSQANECFAQAALLSSQEADLWLEWAEFLLESAYLHYDIQRVRACLEKCHHAYACDPENPLILCTWAQALAFLGQLTEQLDLIFEAENKISEALNLDENEPAVWHSYGLCYMALGAYFQDYDYYYQAIEKLQEGISIDRTYDPLWHTMGNAYATVAILDDDTQMSYQSLKFYETALKLKATSTRRIDYARTLAKLGEVTHEQKWLEQAINQFEYAINMQKNTLYLHPEWLFSYASTLDMLGDFHEDETYYTRAIEIFSHVLMVDPDFYAIHHRLAQAFCHLGELLCENDYFYRALHHLRLAKRHDEDNDAVILDWGIALINISQHTPIITDVHPLLGKKPIQDERTWFIMGHKKF